MNPLVTLMAAMLGVGVFFEGYARTRAYRAIDNASEQADTVLRLGRRRALAQSYWYNDLVELEDLFELPGSVRVAPIGAYTLAGVNVIIFILVGFDLSGERFTLTPSLWDPAVVAAPVLLGAHIGLALLVRKSQKEILRELSLKQRLFADQLMGQILSCFLPIEKSSAADEALDGWRLVDLQAVVQTQSVDYAPVDDLYDSRSSDATFASYAISVVSSLRRLGKLSVVGRSEALTVERICNLIAFATTPTIERARAARNAAKRLIDDSDLKARGHSPIVSTHSTAGLLASATAAEHLARFWKSQRTYAQLRSVEVTEVDQLGVHALAEACERLRRDSVIPPGWVFPESSQTWRRAGADLRPEAMKNLGRLLSKYCQDRDDQSVAAMTLEVAASLTSGSLYDGRDLVASMREILRIDGGSGARAVRSTILANADKGASPETPPWRRGPSVMHLDIALLLSSQLPRSEAINTFVVSATDWTWPAFQCTEAFAALFFRFSGERSQEAAVGLIQALWPAQGYAKTIFGDVSPRSFIMWLQESVDQLPLLKQMAVNDRGHEVLQFFAQGVNLGLSVLIEAGDEAPSVVPELAVRRLDRVLREMKWAAVPQARKLSGHIDAWFSARSA